MAKPRGRVESPNLTIDVDDAIHRFCPSWFDIANGKVRRNDPNDLVTQLSLLRILNLRQALIKWQSWNCQIELGSEIRERYVSFVEQVKLMAQLLRVRAPPVKAMVDKQTPALQATRMLLQYDCTHWLDEQLVKTAGVLRQAARANLYHDAHELFLQLRFELDREWGRRHTEMVVQHEDQRHSDILEANVSKMSMVLTVLSMIIYVTDVGSDVATTVNYFKKADVIKGSLTLFWILWTALVAWVTSRQRATREPIVTSGVFSFALPLLYLWRELKLEWKIWCCKGTISERHQMMVELGDTEQAATALTYTEANNEALPQLLLHIQFLLRSDPVSFTPLTVLAMSSSIISACWSYMINFRGMYSPTSFCYKTQCILFVQDCSGFLALYIVMSLFFWVTPIWVSPLVWLGRTLLFMFLDGTLSFEETLSEMSTLSACITFLERFLFYATHPFRPKHVKYGVVMGGLVELTVVILSYAFASCTQNEAFLVKPVAVASGVLGFSILVRNLSVWLQITEW